MSPLGLYTLYNWVQKFLTPRPDKSCKLTKTTLGLGGIYNPVVVLGTRRVQSLTGIEIRNWKMAQNLNDMRVPPGNRLEALSGDRKGQWSIRINGQYRICFRWIDNNPMYVEIVDYH